MYMNVSLDNVKFMTNNNATLCMVFSVTYFSELHRAFPKSFFFLCYKMSIQPLSSVGKKWVI